MGGGGVPEARVVLGDALDVLRTLEPGSVDAVITDPPYSSGGLFRGDRTGGTVGKYTTSYGRRGLPEFSGDNRDQRSYGYWCALWLGQCLRAARPGAVCCLFADWRQLPTTTDALQAGGWVWRGVAVWDKTEAARPARGRFRGQAEFVAWGSAGPLPEERGVGCLPGVFRCAVSGEEKLHTAGKPEALMRDLVAICPEGGLVLDPFAGSGTTGVACLQTGRRFLGVELDPACHAVAERRLREAAPLFAARPPPSPSLFAEESPP